MALRDFEAPHRKRIERMRARMGRDKSRLAKASQRRRVDDPTVTGVGGTVLRLNDNPLAGVTVSIGGRSIRTDRAGRFELAGIQPGHHELAVDSRTAPASSQADLKFPERYGIADLGYTEDGREVQARTLPGVGTILDDQYLKPLNDQEASDLFKTIIHEGVHHTLDPDDPRQFDLGWDGLSI